jgi:dihydrofolate synthase/folylpolyglutamate synthase
MQRLTAGPYGEAARAADAELWLDGGHNPHAGAALAVTLAERQARAPRPLALIVGILANKDAGGFFAALSRSGAAVFTVPFDGAAAEPEALAAVARGHGLGATACASVEAALGRALRLGAGRVVICGSLYLAGEVLGAGRETWPD